MIDFLFRGIAYVFFGITMEVIFSVTSIELCLGEKISKHNPRKYLEGFTSLYMIPIYLFGVYYGFEFFHAQISHQHILLRYMIYCSAFTMAEALSGFLMHKIIGFYTWDYYKLSAFRVFKEGYTLWTLFPLWGIAGLALEQYSSLLIHLTPIVKAFYGS